MVNINMPEYEISVEQLRPGVFVRLKRSSWFDHPFLFNSFKIKDDQQIALLKKLGIANVICVPEKSDVLPLRPADKKTIPEPDEVLSQEAIDQLWEVKRARTKRLRVKKEQLAQCELKFTACIREFDNILKGVLGGNNHSVEDALAFVNRLCDYFLEDRESTLHLMNVMDSAESAYSHPMNVAVLSMMVGKEANLDANQMISLGMGALFHDIGKSRIPKKLLKKRGTLTKPEQDLIDQHSTIGATMLAEIDIFPMDALNVVAHHHERMDGSGGPEGLQSDQIDYLSRIVAIADTYDNHCNHPESDKSLTPYLALSYMFGQQKHLFDIEVLALFIRCLGVYPPGTVVELNNGAIGMVMAVNPKNQLNPSVVLYDEEVPKKEALIVDLADEQDLRVEKSIRLAHLPDAVLEYLSPRSRITYYVDPS